MSILAPFTARAASAKDAPGDERERTRAARAWPARGHGCPHICFGSAALFARGVVSPPHRSRCHAGIFAKQGRHGICLCCLPAGGSADSAHAEQAGLAVATADTTRARATR